MSKENFKRLAKATGILNFIGAGLVLLSILVAIALLLRAAPNSSGESAFMVGYNAANTGFVLFLKILVVLIGLATFVLSILLLIHEKKFGKTYTAAVLTLIAAVFSGIITYIALVLWIIAGCYLVTWKFTEDDKEEAAEAPNVIEPTSAVPPVFETPIIDQEPQNWRCTTCEQLNSADNKYCVSCGAAKP